jgi:molecular chaperone DnaK
MPVVRAFFEQIFGRQAEQGVDPMECVACGAAIQAGILAGEVKDIVLVDVTPLTLGVETLGGVATPLIARNTPVPVRKTETFTTAADLQTSVTVHVFQGERAMAADNVGLGEFNLDGIPPAPRGIPKIEVSFDLDASGILDVSARDVASGRSQSVRISGSTRLDRGIKERMVQEAEQYAEADRQRRESAETFNECESLGYQAEKMVADFADKLTPEMKDKLEQARRQAGEAVAGKDLAQVKESCEALRKLLKEAGTMVYVQAQPPGTGPYQEVRYGSASGPGGAASPTRGPSASGGARVVDADYH